MKKTIFQKIDKRFFIGFKKLSKKGYSSRKSNSLLSIVVSITLVTSLLAPALTFTREALAADTGWRNPGTVEEPGSQDDWFPQDNIKASDNQYAATTLSDNETSGSIRATNFGFSIPAGATINGVVVDIERKVNKDTSDGCDWHDGHYNDYYSPVQDAEVKIIDAGGNVVGDNKATATNYTKADTYESHGGPTNLWGLTLTRTIINDIDFGVSIKVKKNGSGCGDINTGIDHVKMTVYYTLPSHTITASASTGGSISPSGTVSIVNGANQIFNIQPNAGYIVSDVLVDSVSQGKINSKTFNNVTTDYTISASFENGWKRPNGFENDDGVYHENKVYSSNDDYAIFDDSDDEVEYKNFNFDISPGSTISGIEVALEGNRTEARTVNVSLSWNSGDNWTTGSSGVENAGASFTFSDSTVLIGGVSDNWGKTWSDANFDNNHFRVKIDATSGGGWISLDQIQVKVYYTAAAATTLNADAASGTYGGTTNLSATLSPAASGKTIAFSLNGSPVGTADTNGSGVATLNGVSLSGINADTYATGVSANFAGDASYGSSSDTASLTVNQAPLTITANHQYKTVGQALNLGNTKFTPSGLVGGSDSVTSVTLTSDDASDPLVEGEFEIVPSDAQGTRLGNYTISYENGALTVNEKQTPIITWSNPADITYGDLLTGDQLNASADVTGTFTYTPAAGARLDAGNNQPLHVEFTPAEASEYNSASKDVTINVLKRGLTVYATGQNKTYDGTDAATVTLSFDRGASLVFAAFLAVSQGLLEGDDVIANYGSVSFNNANAGAEKPITVSDITISGADAGNYEANISALTYADIFSKTLIITANSQEKTFDQTLTFAGTEFTAVGLVEGESLASVSLASQGAGAKAQIGDYPIAVSEAVATEGTDLGNYNIVYVNGRQNINDVEYVNGVLSVIEQPAPVISDESISAGEISATSFTANWETPGHPSTSRVIYDTVSHPGTVDPADSGSMSNYGYAYSTGETNTDPKVTNHSVAVSGLTAGTTYYYRVISHGSPETVSGEKSVTTSSVSSGGGTTSSGGGVASVGLTISNLMINLSSLTDTSVTINWLTSHAATGYMLYALASEPHTLNLLDTAGTPALYGFPHSTPEDLNKVTYHTVIITDLTPGTTYYFRPVSHGSLAVGEEGSFTTLPKLAAAEVSTPNPAGQVLGEKITNPASTPAGQVLGLKILPATGFDIYELLMLIFAFISLITLQAVIKKSALVKKNR